MNVTTISIDFHTKRVLERAKKIFEGRLNKKLSWDDFLLFLLSSQNVVDEIGGLDVLELDDREAEILGRMLRKGRESWKDRVSTQAS